MQRLLSTDEQKINRIFNINADNKIDKFNYAIVTNESKTIA